MNDFEGKMNMFETMRFPDKRRQDEQDRLWNKMSYCEWKDREGGPESKTAGEWADKLMEYVFEINTRFTESQRTIQYKFDLFIQKE